MGCVVKVNSMVAVLLVWSVLTLNSFAVYAEHVSLGCQEGWTNVGVQCYRLFPQQMTWDMAVDVCQRYSSHLLRIKDLDRKEEALAELSAEYGITHLWLAYTTVARHDLMQQQQQQQHLLTESPPALRHVTTTPSVQGVGPLPSPTGWSAEVGQMNGTSPGPGQCVLARVVVGTDRMVWGFAPCSRLTAFLCQRPAAPADSFHCSNGGFVEQRFACDNEDDCGDESDEINCESQCRHHVKATEGVIMTPEWTNPLQAPVRHCIWLLETPVGSNVRLEIDNIVMETGRDEVVVLAGGMTVSTSRQVARQDTDVGMAYFVSVNNLMMLTVTSKANDTDIVNGFSATFSTMKAEGFKPQQELSGTSEAQDLMSPFYPGYMTGQDYVWVITALHPHHIITLQIMEVDLGSSDIVEIRDGNSVYAPLLHALTSWRATEHVTYVQSTQRQLFIAMRTRGLDAGRGFYFRYWQGCSIELNENSGSIVSPGYLIKGANYPANRTCVYDVTVPELKTATLVFDTVDVDTSDELRIESGGLLVHTVTGTEVPDPIDLSRGTFRLTFRSDSKVTSRGFALRYSVGCPALLTNSRTTVRPEAPVYHFGSKVTLTCGQGYAFPPLESQPQSKAESSLVLECTFGGAWNGSATSTCQAFCRPGWFYEKMTESCEVCPIHHYQSDVNATSCRTCPPGTVTEKEGSNSSSECKPACPAGQWYCHSMGGCETCPLGTFQNLTGQFSCLPCPLFKTTPRPGANSSTLCSVAVLDKDTEQELGEQELIVVSFQDGNQHQHHHHQHHHRRRRPPSHRSTSGKLNPLSTLLLHLSQNSTSGANRMGAPKSAPEGMVRQGKPGGMSGIAMNQSRSEVQKNTKNSNQLTWKPSGRTSSEGYTRESADVNPGKSMQKLLGFLSSRDLQRQLTHSEISQGSVWKSQDLAGSEEFLRKLLHVLTSQDSTGKASKVVNSSESRVEPSGAGGGEGLPGSERPGFLAVQQDLKDSERVKRDTKDAEEELEEGTCSGSGGEDPCQMTTGQLCDPKQDCVPDCDTFICVCKPAFQENERGECVDLPETHKLYLTTPFALTYDPDLSFQSSVAFLTFQMECQDAFTDIFRGVEGWKAVQVLYFRSDGQDSQQTVVVYALLFTVGVTEEMKVKAALTVLHMEQVGDILVGSRNLTLAGHTGIFLSLADTLTSTDNVDWCGVASLHQCEGSKECVDRGLRYTCQCPASTSDLGGSCVNVGAVAGGVVGGLLVIILIVVVIVIVLRRRRRVPRAYSRPEGAKPDERARPSYSDYSNINPAFSREEQNEEMVLTSQNIYNEPNEPRPSHHYDTFTPYAESSRNEELQTASEPSVYSESGPRTSHQYEAFRFGEGRQPQGPQYANMALASGPATLNEPSTSGGNRVSGEYMNVKKGESSGQEPRKSQSHVYSNIGRHQ